MQIAAAGAIAVLAMGFSTGAVVAGGNGGDDAGETAITGTAKTKAEAAALEAVGAGTVTGTEVDDEESEYEVEVTLVDGSKVDVQLDDLFSVVGIDEDGADESEGADDEGQDAD